MIKLTGRSPENGSLKPGETDDEYQRTVRRSLKYVLWEGGSAGIVQRITDSFFTPFALVLKASAPQIGLLSAIPNFAGAVSQLAAPKLVALLGSRKRLLLLAVLLGVLVWLPIAFFPWIFGQTAVGWFLVLATLTLLLFQLPSPAWGSWVPQLISHKHMGGFMAKRGILALVLSAGIALAAARWLDIMHNRIFLAFMVVFLIAAAFRLSSLLLFARVYEPPSPGKPSSNTGLGAFLRTLPSTNLGRFIGYTMSLSFAANVAGPFFMMFMLQDLGFSYTTVMLLQMVGLGAHVVGLRFWGAFADRRGNLLVVKLTAPFAGVLPMLWLIDQSVPYLMVVEVIGGLAWSGWQLCAVNFIYESSRPEDRTRTVAYFNAFNGTGVLVGALLGGFLAPFLPRIFAYSLMTLFLMSGILRLAAAALLLLVKEVRETPQQLIAKHPLSFRFNIASTYGWPLPPRRNDRDK